MKILSFALLSVAVLTGCGTPDYHFTAYVGKQQNWTTLPGSYVKVVDGVQIYTHYPPQPYELIGAVSVDNEKDLAEAVKFYHADAAMIYSTHTRVNGTVVVSGPPVYPGHASRINAQLIRFKH